MDKTNRQIIGTAIGAILIVLAGVLTAPLVLPIMKSFFTKQLPDYSSIIAASGNSDQLGAYLRLVGNTVSSTVSFGYLITWLIVLFVMVGLFVLYQHYSKPARVVDGASPLGNSELITGWTRLRAKNDFYGGKGIPKHAGLVLGASSRGYIYDHSIPHMLVVGKTGSGKDQLICLESLHLAMAMGINLLVTGKPELVELTGKRAVADGYQRVIFDLNGYPGASGFNPIDLVAHYAEQGMKAEAQKTARQTADDLIPIGNETQTYFPKAARSALTGIILMVAYADIPRSQKNMASVYDIVARGTSGEGKDPSLPLKSAIRALGEEHPAYGPSADFLSDGGVTVAGKNVLSNLKQALTIFGDESIRRTTAKSDVSMEELINRKSIVYFHLLEEGDPYQVLFTAWFNQWYRVASAAVQRNGGRLPHETAILGNEFGNLGRVECIGQICTLGRSMKLHAWLMVQDLKQLNAYNRPGDNGAGRDKILGSIGGKVALSLANTEDAAYFSKLVGKHTVRTQATSKQKNGGGRNAQGESYSETADDLIHEWEWQNRVAVRDGSIVIKGGENASPGREGVFEMPLDYANKTPAGKYFNLGSEEDERAMRIAFYEDMNSRHDGKSTAVETWCPDFSIDESDIATEIVADEFSAWD